MCQATGWWPCHGVVAPRVRYGRRFRLQQLICYRAELVGLNRPQLRVSDHSLTIDNDSEGKRGQAIAQRLGELNGAIATDEGRIIEVELFGELVYLVGLVRGDADKLKAARPKLALYAHEFGHLLAAWRTPGGPEIDHHHLTAPLSEALLLA